MQGSETRTCATCGAVVTGAYCASCGEKSLVREELTLAEQARQVWSGLVRYDAKTLRSLVLLGLRPGFLAFEYCRGARIRYLKPVQLFLLANVLYFLAAPYLEVPSLRSALEARFEGKLYDLHFDAAFRQQVEASGGAVGELAQQFREVHERWARALLALLVPPVTLVLALFDTRRKRTLIEQAVLALNFVAFAVLYAQVGVGFAVGKLTNSADPATAEVAVTAATEAVLILWWTLAFQRFYGWHWRRGLLQALAMAHLVFPLVIGYRYLLGWLTLWTL
ncbi:MAG: DUF3667 domain-containing protein [Planctomycetaceae bacterium]|nr:DUF3667 domain-containing protein [Planctomycetaceae bacterium]